MKKKNGFTLTELIAVIVIIGIIAIIAVPTALNLSKKVKKKALDTKIDLIESTAKDFGEQYITFVMQGDNMIDSSKNSWKCIIPESGNIEAGPTVTGENAYPCVRITVKDLAEAGEINYDEENGCADISSCDQNLYSKQVQDLKNKYIINKCYVYMYYKNKRAYSHFDKSTCLDKTDVPTEGHEYAPLKKN